MFYVQVFKACITLMIFYFGWLLKFTVWSFCFCLIRRYLLSRYHGQGTRCPWSHGRLRSPWGPGLSSAVWRQQSEHLPHGAVWGLNMAWKVRGGARLIPSTKHLDFNCCYYSERRKCSERVFIYSYKKLCVCVYTRLLSHVWLFAIPWTAACQVPLSRGLSRQEYWRGLPIPSLEDLPDPWTEPASLMSPALADGFFTTSATWRDLYVYISVFLSVFLRG